MFGLIKKIFIGLLTGLVNGSNYRKCVSLSNKKCKNARNEDSHEFEYYPFSVKLDRFAGSCNTINDLSNQLCITNKTEDLNLSVFSMITGINESKILTKHMSCESKTLTKHISCECKCRFDGRKCNSDQWWSNNKCRCVCKKIHVCEKNCLESCDMYLENI